jgi:type II secretory pathway pseudopilin PulG
MTARREGYALPMTLAAIIVIGLVAAMAAEQVRSSTRTVSALMDQMRARTAMSSAEQTLIYGLLTEPMTADGVAYGANSDMIGLFLGGQTQAATETGALVPANGLPHRYDDTSNVIVRLYDDQTFIDADNAGPDYISSYLSLFDVPAQLHPRLTAALRDYQDSDDLRSLGGAEAGDYEQDGMPPNTPLRDALELCAVKYWSETAVCEDTGRLLLTFRTRNNERLNPRLASEALLGLMVDPASNLDAGEAFRRFANREYTQFSQINRDAFDIIRDPLSTLTLPGPNVVIVTQTPDALTVQRTVVELTPNSLISPFVVHSKYAIGGGYSQNILRIESIDDVAPLPEPPSIHSERTIRTGSSGRAP